MKGRKPTPDNVKAIRGTVQPCRQQTGGPDVPILDELPDPPDWLPNSHALKEWERVGPVLLSCKLLTVANLAPFAQLCALHGKIVQLWTAGETPNASMLAQYIKYASEFAMTPASQSRIRAGDKDGRSGNKFVDGGPKSAKKS